MGIRFLAIPLLAAAMTGGIGSYASAQQAAAPAVRATIFVSAQPEPGAAFKPIMVMESEPDGKSMQTLLSDPHTLHRAIVRLPDGREEVWQAYACVNGSVTGVTMGPLGQELRCSDGYTMQK
ncbi:hypothetical protein ABMY26_07390 (plasmid) [Azospirillum sp. HJ39]|uniref:hypothetical protein n=1 Tax=Azospirillum sp. HJ39 TaxID=3159496 RepID=UPI00355729C6